MKKVTHYGYINHCIFFLFFLFGCNSSPKQDNVTLSEESKSQYPITIPFEKGVTTEKAIALSEIASRVTYIPLETKAEGLISRIRGFVRMTQEFVYIPTSKGVFQFAKDGKFVRQIGKKGQGPGEYTNVLHFTIDESSNRIYIFGGLKLLIYTLDGTYVSESKFHEALQIAPLNDTTIVSFIHNGDGQQANRILLTNTEGKVINRFPQYDQFSAGRGSWMIMTTNDRYLFSYDDKVCFKDYYNDTLFVVTPNALLPRYVIEMGKYELPVENRFERLAEKREHFNRLAGSSLRPNLIETDNYVFIPYSRWAMDADEKYELVMFDKKSQECFHVQNNFIENDIDDGLPFHPSTSISDNSLLSVWETSDILERMEKDPTLKQHETLKHIKEDDNPVLMIVNLKK